MKFLIIKMSTKNPHIWRIMHINMITGYVYYRNKVIK